MCRTDLGVGVDPALLPPAARGLAQATPALSSAVLLRGWEGSSRENRYIHMLPSPCAVHLKLSQRC